jgi:hypothetical protein
VASHDSPPARHRAGGFARRLALRRDGPRHAGGPRRRRPLPLLGWVILIGAVGGLVTAATVAILMRPPGRTRAETPVPTAPPASTPPAPAYRPSAATGRATPQATSPTPYPTPTGTGTYRPSPSATATMVGPHDVRDLLPALTAYCRRTAGKATSAVPTEDGWACRVVAPGSIEVDLDKVCVWYYGRGAWAEMLRDGDQYSWRCYRDPP